MRDIGRRLAVLATAGAALASMAPAAAQAQVVLDGTTGPARALTGPDYAIGAELGRRAGGNLFHSFERFGLRTGERATFSGPAGIANVISRVTGGERSDVDGTLRSTIPGADLWFLNPAGVVFGPNARLDVQGSFHVSTADELRFADGARFSAADPAASSFTVAPPEAFGFLGAEPADLVVDRGQLGVPPGEALSLVGGDVTVTAGNNGRASGGGDGTVQAEAGRITLAALGGPGAVAVGAGESTAADLADIRLIDQALVDVSGAGGGTVRIRGGRFVAENRSLVVADNTGAMDSTAGIAIQAGAVTIGSGSAVTADALGSGDAGDVAVDAEHIKLETAGSFRSDTYAAGKGGSVIVTAQSLELFTEGYIRSTTQPESGGPAGIVDITASRLHSNNGFIGSNTFGIGDAGSVFISAGRLEFENEGRIFNGTNGPGDGGDVVVTADTITADATADHETRFHTGIASTAEQNSTGKGGNISITAREIILKNGGLLSTGTAGEADAGLITIHTGRLEFVNEGRIFNGTDGPGDGGNIVVVADTVFADATPIDHEPQFHTGIAASANPGSSGRGGDVTVSARRIDLSNGSFIGANTWGRGDAGTVTIDAGRLEFVNEGRIFNGTNGAGAGGDVAVTVDVLSADATVDHDARFHTGIASTAEAGSTGAGGDITVSARRIDLSNGGLISTATFGIGAGGDIAIEAQGLTLAGRGVISAETFDSGAGGDITISAPHLSVNNGFIGANTRGPADAGTILVEAGRVEFVNEGRIFNGTDGAGDGGDIIVTADMIRADETLDHEARFHTGISASANFGSSGMAGDVTVAAREIRLVNGGEVSSGTAGAGAGGDVVVIAREELSVAGADPSGRPGGVFASSNNRGSDAPGGTVLVSAPRITLADVGQIASSSEGGGVAGTISIGSGDVSTVEIYRGDELIDVVAVPEVDALLMSDASIIAETARADAGDVRVFVRDLVDLRASEVTTSAASGAGGGGNILIDPRFVILDGSRIVADAFAGAGGDITIQADNLIQSPDSIVRASSRLGLPGTVAISAPDEDVSRGLVALPAMFLDATALLPASCAARRSGDLSSFTAAGRGGLPPGPDGPLPGFYALGPGGVGAATAATAPRRGDRRELAAAPPRPAPVAVALGCGG